MNSEFKIETLNRMVVFAEVVQQGSMSAAARALQMSPSAVSQQIRSLERETGVVLLHRTTRRLVLTQAGVEFQAHCAAMLSSARKAWRDLGAARDLVKGELRVTAPAGSAHLISDALRTLLSDHPKLQLHLETDDRMIDLMGERVDLALRFGPMDDSSWVAQPLGDFEWALCSSPAYMSACRCPASPVDLVGLQWLATLRHRDHGLKYRLSNSLGEAFALEVRPRIFSNSLSSLHQLALNGMGVAFLLRANVQGDLDAGRLLELLSQWRPAALTAYAVTPHRERQPARVRLAIAAIRSHLAHLPGVKLREPALLTSAG